MQNKPAFGCRRSDSHPLHPTITGDAGTFTSVDLRTSPFMPPILYQGVKQACVANHLQSCLWFAQKKEAKPVPVMASRAFLWYVERAHEGTQLVNVGVSIPGQMQRLSDVGFCSETMWPYTSLTATQPSHDAYVQAITEEMPPPDYYALSGAMLASVKAVLASGFPVLLGVELFRSGGWSMYPFYNPIPMPTPGEAIWRSHALMIVGYDDAKGLLTARNCWGAASGDKGHVYLHYDYARYFYNAYVVKVVP